eukprot:6195461-Pleurochrysis_carterae.AAC.6
MLAVMLPLTSCKGEPSSQSVRAPFSIRRAAASTSAARQAARSSPPSAATPAASSAAAASKSPLSMAASRRALALAPCTALARTGLGRLLSRVCSSRTRFCSTVCCRSDSCSMSRALCCASASRACSASDSDSSWDTCKGISLPEQSGEEHE